VPALEDLIESERQRFKVEGAAVGIVHNGEVLLCRGFGQRDRGAALPVTDQTLFAIGSSTKAFTASLVAALVDDGRIAWDKPVRDYVPAFRMHDEFATEHMTPRDLLCHRAGLPRHDLAWYNNTSVTRAEMVRRLRYLEPNASFRQIWQYNNLMYITAGHLAEEMLGCTWEDGVRQRLLDPIGMARTNFSTLESQKTEDHAIPYTERDGEVIEVDFRELPLAGPAGSMNSTVSEMLRWIQVQLGGGCWGDTQVISPAALHELHAPTMVMPEGPQLWDETYMTGYALGWMLENYRGHRLVHHGGNIDGFSTLVSFAPRDGIGVVVLSNQNATPLPTALTYSVLDSLLDLSPLPWGERFRGLLEAMRTGAKEAVAHQSATARDLPPSHPLDEYVGTYAHDGYGPLRVTRNADALVPHFNDLELICSHRHLDTWDLELKIFDLHFPMTFWTDVDGEIGSVSVPMEPSVAPIVFHRVADALDVELLSQMTGQYEMGPLVVTVALKRETLTVSIAGQGTAELEPHRGLVFKIKGQAATTVEFVRSPDGTFDRVVAQPVGVFTRVAT
jgi:CubicO group peptidase (beta-lactamase class C family)